jgi:hypothetical protein
LPAADHRPHVRHQINRHHRQGYLLHGTGFRSDRKPVRNEWRDPEQIKPPHRVGENLRDGKRPHLPVAEQLSPRQANWGIRRVTLDECQLLGRQPRMLPRSPVNWQPQRQPHEPAKSRRQKRRLPTKRLVQNRHKNRRDRRADIGGRVDDPCRASAPREVAAQSIPHNELNSERCITS